jgi:hypothetical protein
VELADFIRLGGREPALRFLIIGGYAVAAHGHTRVTFDVDLLVRRADREAWFIRLTADGLALRHSIDLRQQRYEELFLKHGTREIYDTFLRLLRDA